MADILDTVQKFINSPPGQLAAGGVLAGIVWKFFERVEAVLTDNTKLEIAVWLLGIRTERQVERWPNTFLSIFDRVFGSRHLTVRCFTRSAIASLAALLLMLGIYFATGAFGSSIASVVHPAVIAILASREDWIASELRITILIGLVIGNIIPDYISLLVTRSLLSLFRQSRRLRFALGSAIALIVVISAIAFLGMLATEDLSLAYLGRHAHFANSRLNDFEKLRADLRVEEWQRLFQQFGTARWLWFYPAFFGCSWFLLYAGSGFMLKAARRFDIGFEWFNRKFDVEKKPLQSIGLVAGALVAVGYWVAVVVTRVVA
jgi:hypothetical protein